ncbi:MAG: hypothetical protein AABZ31_10295, partial [Bdellovibrionota bacterium]
MSTANFWDHHGVFFLIFITLFPRLTLFFSSVAFGGVFWWIGFIFAPRFLVAILATINYMQSNPILVAISWIVAISGESSEKYALHRNIKIVRFGGFNHRPPPMRDVSAIPED